MIHFANVLRPIDNNRQQQKIKLCGTNREGCVCIFISPSEWICERWKLINSLFNLLNKNRSTPDSHLFNCNASRDATVGGLGSTIQATDRQTGNRTHTHTHTTLNRPQSDLNECASSHIIIRTMQITTCETVYTDLFAYLHSINVKR